MRIRSLLALMVLCTLAVSVSALASVQSSCSVLLIWDTQGGYTPNLVTALQNAGLSVTLSATDLTGYDGTNPNPTSFGCVILLDGTTCDQGMPTAGQQALVNYVQNGGFIETEWLANDFLDGYFQDMRDLILFDRTSGWEDPNTYTVVPGMGSHPVLAGIPSSFTFQTGYNIGPAHTFATDPVTVLMTDSRGSAAVAVRQFGSGRIVGFNHAGNYNGYDALADPNIDQLFVNAAEWSCSISNLYNLSFQDDYGRSALCVNSTTGAWQYSVLKGNGTGNTYSGTGTIVNGSGYTRLTATPGSGYGLNLIYYTTAHRATATFTYRPDAVSSALYDASTLDDPATCGQTPPPLGWFSTGRGTTWARSGAGLRPRALFVSGDTKGGGRGVEQSGGERCLAAHEPAGWKARSPYEAWKRRGLRSLRLQLLLRKDRGTMASALDEPSEGKPNAKTAAGQTGGREPSLLGAALWPRIDIAGAFAAPAPTGITVVLPSAEGISFKMIVPFALQPKLLGTSDLWML